MSEETVDSFASLFSGPPGADQRKAREARARKERRTQLTEKQIRRRGGERTEQINFRCSADFLAKVASVKDHMTESQGTKWSVADVLEEALEMFAKANKIGAR